MGEVSTIGLDIAKAVFQVHGVDEAGTVLIRKRISRTKMLEFFAELPRCLIGIEACPSAHHWGRELQALGHTVKLMPPSYVKAYLKRGKNDANDAAAICEAVTRPSMRFVPIKTNEGTADSLDAEPDPAIAGASAHDAEQRATWTPGRARHRVGQGPQWDGRVAADHRGWCRYPDLPSRPRHSRCAGTAVQRHRNRDRVHRKSILALHRSCEASRRLAEIPGIGPIVATALVAEIGDWKTFSSGRSLAGWIGLVPKQHTTGGKDKLGSITKQGNRYLRWLLVVGAMAVIHSARKHGTQKRPWLGRLMERRPTKVAAVALANKIARMAWAIMVHGDRYKEPKLLLAA